MKGCVKLSHQYDGEMKTASSTGDNRAITQLLCFLTLNSAFAERSLHYLHSECQAVAMCAGAGPLVCLCETLRNFSAVVQGDYVY